MNEQAENIIPEEPAPGGRAAAKPGRGGGWPRLRQRLGRASHYANYRLKNLFRPKGRRYYPRKNDAEGRSARQRAFDLFAEGDSPRQVAEAVDITPETAKRYFSDFKKEGQGSRILYAALHLLRRTDPAAFQKAMRETASQMRIEEAEFMELLERPWGLKQALDGKFAELTAKREQAQELEDLKLARGLMDLVKLTGIDQRTFTQKIIDQMTAEFTAAGSPPPPGPAPASPSRPLAVPPNLRRHLKRRPQPTAGSPVAPGEAVREVGRNGSPSLPPFSATLPEPPVPHASTPVPEEQPSTTAAGEGGQDLADRPTTSDAAPS